ncbi:MAG: peptidylprolyl isomerase [Pseudomonadota bacterium]
MFVRRLIAAAAALFAASSVTTSVSAADPQNTLVMTLKNGEVLIEMRPDLAPVHVDRIKTLVRQGFYDGTPFHRVIDGFMAQGGDPTGTGTGGSGINLPAEFSEARHTRGIVSMARAQSPNSADSQFFIMFADAPFLDGQYTIWGEVRSGMELVDAIKRGEGPNGQVIGAPDRIERMRVLADTR